MHKTILLLTIFTLSFNSFSQDREIDDLIYDKNRIVKNKIKTIEVTVSLIDSTLGSSAILQERKIYKFDPKGNKIIYLDYCPDNRKCDTTNPANRVFYKYNNRNDVIEYYRIDPFTDTVSFREEKQYKYKHGKVVEEKSRHTYVPNWFSIFYSYDGKGRLIKEKFELSDSTYQETIYHYSGKFLDSISYISEEKNETHIFKYDKEGNKIQKSYRFKGKLICGNVTDKEQYEYYPNGKIKSRIIYDRFKTYKDTYEYRDSIVEVKRYSKPELKLIGIEDDFKISSITYMHYNKYGLLELIQDVNNHRTTETKVNYLYNK